MLTGKAPHQPVSCTQGACGTVAGGLPQTLQQMRGWEQDPGAEEQEGQLCKDCSGPRRRARATTPGPWETASLFPLNGLNLFENNF